MEIISFIIYHWKNYDSVFLYPCSIFMYNYQILKIIFCSQVLVINVQISLGCIIFNGGELTGWLRWVKVLPVLAWNPHDSAEWFSDIHTLITTTTINFTA